MFEYEKFISTIRRERKYQEITLRTLSKEIGISTSYLSEIENGKKECSFKIAHKMAKALKMGIEIEVKPIGPKEKK